MTRQPPTIPHPPSTTHHPPLRREFFKVLSTVSLTGACGKKIDRYIPLLVADREIVPGEEQWHPAACGECGAGCGVIARVMEGERVVERNGEQVRERIACIKKLEGNPLDPVSGGRLCARGQAAVQALYHPDRLRGPMRRTGPRGKGEFAATSWDEALAVAAEKLARIRKADPARILFVTGSQAGSRAASIARFLQALGAPPALTCDLAGFALERHAARQVHGWNGLPVYDLARARYVVGIGADFLGGWASPVFYARQYGQFRQGRAEIRGRFMHAESRFSLTAANADHWIPLHPGSEVWFAAALGHLLVAEKRARQPQAVPPAILKTLETLDLAAAARACGVDEKRLRRVSRELGESEAPLVIAGASAIHTNALDALILASCLNLLLGNVGRPGGVLPPSPEPPGIRAAFANIAPAWQRAEFIFLDGANPLYTLPASARLAERLAQWGPYEALVSFNPFVDDSGAYADLLLPDHHPLESAAALVPATAPGLAVTLATPFVQPLHQTRAVEQTLAALAKKLELDFAPVAARSLVEPMLLPGANWNEVVRQGGLWRDAPAAPPARPAPLTLVPAPPSFDGDPARFPLLFQPYLSLQFHDGRSAHLPWMQELPDPASSAMWELPVEVDAQTAAKLGIRNGDRVRVASAHGELEAPAYVHPAAMPGVVSMAIGQGHRHFGRYASGRGSNPLAILAPVWDQATGTLVAGATRVSLTRLAARAGLIQFSPQDRELGPWGHR